MAQGENLFTGSAAPFTSSNWSAVQASKAASLEQSPIAGFNPCDIVDNAVNTLHTVRQTVAAPDPYALEDKARFCVSCFVKPQSRSWFVLFANGTTIGAWFDLGNGLLGTESGCQATIEPAGNGFFYCGIWLNFGSRLAFGNTVNLTPTVSNGASSYAGNGDVACTILAPHLVKANYPDPLVATGTQRKVGPIENSLKGPQI